MQAVIVCSRRHPMILRTVHANVQRNGGEFLERRNEALDGLRGYAALAVAVFHTVLGIDPALIARVQEQDYSSLAGVYDRLNWVVLRTFNGSAAVAIFFTLSGAVLFDSLRRVNGSPVKLSAVFLLRRFLRIYPALIVCLAVMTGAFLMFGIPVSMEGLIANALLHSFPINGATWTLAVEMLAAPAILVAIAGYSLGREAGLLLAGIAIALVLNIKGLAMGPIKVFWPYFLIGMLIPTRIGGAVARMMPRRGWWIVMIVLLYFSGPTTEKICCGLLIASLYHGSGGALGDVLQRPEAVFLGRISYSFYLYNVMFLEIICSHLRGTALATAFPLETGLVMSVVVIVLTVPVAYASMKWIEEPFNRLGRAARGTAAEAARGNALV